MNWISILVPLGTVTVFANPVTYNDIDMARREYPTNALLLYHVIVQILLVRSPGSIIATLQGPEVQKLESGMCVGH